VAAFPDEHGVGIRNSVREALAAGLPVVATPIAAREQEAHPLLTVERDTSLFVRQIIHHLTSESPGQSDSAPVRTWEEVAGKYLAELQEAIAERKSERRTEEPHV
jgi:glycosyltransferase involved in cell wall biosynthesis